MYIVNLYNVKWKKKYTRDEISKATGLSRATIDQLFSGKYRNYNIRTLYIIATFFDCKISEILVKINE